MESLDEVIDAMIADRVIHRHRRIWLVVTALVVLAAVVVFFTGGWKEKKGRTVPTLSAPANVTAGRFEFNFTKAEIVRTPKGKYTDAKAELRVYFDVKNIDTEKQESHRVDSDLLKFVPGGGKDLVDSNGADCRGEIGWVMVYGLPPESCFTKFDVDPEFAADLVEVGVLGEKYEGDSGLMGAKEDPYWQNETPTAVVQLKPTVVVDNGENK